MTVIDFAGWVHNRPDVPVPLARRRSLLAIVAGAALFTVAVAGAATMILTRDFPAQIIVGVVLVGGVGWLLLRNGVVTRRALRSVTTGFISTVPPFAFALAEGRVQFPAYFANPSEDWPLRGTTARSGRFFFAPALIVTHPGRHTRRYYAKALALPVSEIVRIIEDAERGSGG